MLQDLQEAINKNLPTQVGEALKKRLQQADDMEKQIPYHTEKIANLEREIVSLMGFKKQAEDFSSREFTIMKGERKLELDTAVLAIRQEMTTKMADQNKEIVLSVFQNSKFKYMCTNSENGYVNGQSHNLNKSKIIESSE